MTVTDETAVNVRIPVAKPTPGIPGAVDAKKSKVAGADEIVALAHGDQGEALRRLATSKDGLTVAEARARRKAIGPNAIGQEERPTIFAELAGRARNPLNALLLILAVTSYFLGDLRASIVIGVMVVLAIATAFIQEHRSNETAAKLRALVKNTASVRRIGLSPSEKGTPFTEIPSEGLVPGDIVHLSAGDMIPGDLLLLEAKDLFVNEATLTGEAMPAEKRSDAAGAQAASPFDCANLCFMGSSVVGGFAARDPKPRRNECPMHRQDGHAD